MIGKWARAVLFSTVTLTAAACGGAAPQAETKAPGQGATDEPRTAEEAQDQIEAARAAIDQSLRAEPPAAPAAESGDAPKANAPDQDDACAGRCRALGSMKRAVDALCRMTGETEARCVSARRTFDASSTRVADCKCPLP